MHPEAALETLIRVREGSHSPAVWLVIRGVPLFSESCGLILSKALTPTLHSLLKYSTRSKLPEAGSAVCWLAPARRRTCRNVRQACRRLTRAYLPPPAPPTCGRLLDAAVAPLI